jgi:3-hydroxyacyl-CoA dehydrogenase
MLINEAVEAKRLGVANDEDIELAMQKGVNYPKGLLSWGKEIGYSKSPKLCRVFTKNIRKKGTDKVLYFVNYKMYQCIVYQYTNAEFVKVFYW